MEPIELTAVRPAILVVDDSPAMRRYLRLLLESDSYLVETAESGLEALHCVQRGRTPDVVLLDMQMPDLDGLQTLRILRKLRPDLKVIMCSGVDDPRQIRRASLMGACSYLTKPVQHLYLTAALEHCLSHAPMVKPASLPPVLTLFPSAGND